MSIYNMTYYSRSIRANRLKKAMAWIGITISGSLFVFSAGVCVIRFGFYDAIISLAIALILAWGLWGFVFLKTRH